MTPDQKKRYNESARKRMSRLRAKKKEESSDKIETRQMKTELAKRREQWRESKRKEMAAKTPEQREQMLLKRREQYQAKKKDTKISVSKDPKMFADVISSLIVAASPKKKSALINRGIHLRSKCFYPIDKRIVNSIKEEVGVLKLQRGHGVATRVKTIIRAVKGQKNLSSEDELKIRRRLGITWRLWVKYGRKIKQHVSESKRANNRGSGRIL